LGQCNHKHFPFPPPAQYPVTEVYPCLCFRNEVGQFFENINGLGISFRSALFTPETIVSRFNSALSAALENKPIAKENPSRGNGNGVAKGNIHPVKPIAVNAAIFGVF
jgi:hypothetical protein